MRIGVQVSMLLAMVSIAACTGTEIASVPPVAREQLYTFQQNSQRADSFFGQGLCGADTTPLFPFDHTDMPVDEVEVGYFSSDLPDEIRRRCRSDKSWEHHATLAFDLTDFARTRRVERLEAVTLISTRRGVEPPLECGTDLRGTRPPEVAGLLVAPPADRPELRGWLQPSVERGAAPSARAFSRTIDVDRISTDWRDFYESRLEMDSLPYPTPRRADGTFELSPERVAAIRDALVDLRRFGTTPAVLYVVIVGAPNPDFERDFDCRARYGPIRLALSFTPAP